MFTERDRDRALLEIHGLAGGPTVFVLRGRPADCPQRHARCFPVKLRGQSKPIDSHFLCATLINTLRISVMPQNEVPHLRSTAILEI